MAITNEGKAVSSLWWSLILRGITASGEGTKGNCHRLGGLIRELYPTPQKRLVPNLKMFLPPEKC